MVLHLATIWPSKMGYFFHPYLYSFDEKKRVLSVLSCIFNSFFQGLSVWSHWCHSQRSRRALLNLPRSLIPKPPHFFGLKHVCQLTRQCSPLTLSGSWPFHKKLVRNLSIFAIAHLFSLNTIMKYVGMAVSTVLTSSSLPGYVMKSFFHSGNLSAIFYTDGCIVARDGFLFCSERPKYLQGKLEQDRTFCVRNAMLDPHSG